MSIFHGLDTTGSALTAQRLRMDVISSNMANAETTRAKMVDGEWQPYRRKTVTLTAQEGAGSFATQLNAAIGSSSKSAGNGVKVTKINEDTTTDFKLTYDPSNPDADQNGYVKLSNVDTLKEMTDLMSATRSYEANVTVFNANKSMLTKALEIGK
ncbi:flagellar basal body rod protein FlgC [Kurthia sibirica]|uniref:Flagellar basal-body rod protein FlgC n=1 Tax=Kurthia sibirica TaxID=202750 RepID=A0A2U3AQR6_9BACL|nr:flagellar basal body rod protein FlgC [Kurthia sibirica]PWI26892.1 flagellar basal body rod protein FlgC [Kurthia sibirica]GEK32568.1 flagellar basal-body rod protein FlgC [Kurthia sibirica]